MAHSKSYNLVVCGALDAERDGFIFSDFLGFSMAMRQKGIGGDFWSCFPVEKHFEILSAKDPPILDVKFGKYGPQRDQAAYILRSWDYEHRKRFWKQVGAAVLKDEFLRWINQKTQIARAGDVVNIIVEAHGGADGFLVLGDHELYNVTLRDTIKHFRDEVQVNIITGACNSGLLVECIRASSQYHRYVQAATAPGELAYSNSRSVSGRFRNCRFAQACVMSLTQMHLPGTVDPSISTMYRVLEHENMVQEHVQRKVSPGHKISRPTSYHGEPVSLQTAASSLLFRDHIDVLYDPATSHRRRRIEWPSINPGLVNLIQTYGNPPAQMVRSDETMAMAKCLIDDEFNGCELQSHWTPDEGAIQAYYYSKRPQDHFGRLLDFLYIRSRKQSAVLDLYYQLCRCDFIQSTNLCRSISSFDTVSHAVRTVVSFLLCFKGISDADKVLEYRNVIGDDQFSHHLTWLATMIVRRCADLPDLLELIKATKYLGDVNDEKYKKWLEYETPVEITCDERAGYLAYGYTTNLFGFWLPCDGSVDPEVTLHTARTRFQRIEDTYQKWYGFSDEELEIKSREIIEVKE